MEKKKMEVQHSKKGLVGGLIALCLVAVFGLGVLGYAAVTGITNTFTGPVTLTQTVDGVAGEQSFGSAGPTATTSSDLLAGFTDVNIASSFRFGDNNTYTSEGITYYLRTVDCTDATITPAVFSNTYGEPIYIDIGNSGLKTIANATDTVSIMYTTSTASFISGDNPRELVNLYYTSVYRPATSSLVMIDSAGANGTAYNATVGRPQKVKLNPDERLLIIATSTSVGTKNGAIVDSGQLFDCRAYVTFSTVD